MYVRVLAHSLFLPLDFKFINANFWCFHIDCLKGAGKTIEDLQY
jgi:hypothetical protein